MKLHIRKSQSESTGLLEGKKKYTYSLRITADLSAEETQLLNKYGYLSEGIYFSKEIMMSIIDKKIKGESTFTVSKLEKGLEWSCDNELLIDFADIQDDVTSKPRHILSCALAREMWGGEEVIDIK